MQKYANFHGYSDVHAFEVVKEVTSKCVEVRRMGATLLNGASSGEPDALKFSPGGFCGHTSGTQRYKFEQTTLPVVRIRQHKNGKWYDNKGGRYIFSDKPLEHFDFNF